MFISGKFKCMPLRAEVHESAYSHPKKQPSQIP